MKVWKFLHSYAKYIKDSPDRLAELSGGSPTFPVDPRSWQQLSVSYKSTIMCLNP